MDEQGIALLKKYADQGDDTAQNALAECYYFGEGVEENYSLAIELWEKAAAQGNEEAQEYLDKINMNKMFVKALNLDKEERYIMGIKIDVSTIKGMDEYEKALIYWSNQDNKWVIFKASTNIRRTELHT